MHVAESTDGLERRSRQPSKRGTNAVFSDMPLAMPILKRPWE